MTHEYGVFPPGTDSRHWFPTLQTAMQFVDNVAERPGMTFSIRRRPAGHSGRGEYLTPYSPQVHFQRTGEELRREELKREELRREELRREELRQEELRREELRREELRQEELRREEVRRDSLVLECNT